MSEKIIINGRFLVHRITGVERYAREILGELDKIVPSGKYEIAIPPEVNDFPKYKNISVKKIGRLHNRLWEHISFPLYVAKKKATSLNFCNVAPLLSPGYVCIHDVKIQTRPQDYSRGFLAWYRLLFWNATKRAKKIITVSEFSKREICRYYNVKPDRIIVIPDAWQHFDRTEYDENALKKYGLENKEFYFSMSSMEPNKNFQWIAEVAKKNKNTQFAIAGSINKEVFANGLGFECPENMELLGYVSDEEAKTLMRECKAFLFPTFYEGFGIPPLEALSTGCKCIIVSDTEVMHEIFENAVIYIDPYDYDINIQTSETKEAISKSVLSRYSWEKSANQIKTLLG